METGKLLAFVRSPDEGPILRAQGCFAEEIEQCGADLSDHAIPLPSSLGLLVFEGHLEHYEDGAVIFIGEWRATTPHELAMVALGEPLW